MPSTDLNVRSTLKGNFSGYLLNSQSVCVVHLHVYHVNFLLVALHYGVFRRASFNNTEKVSIWQLKSLTCCSYLLLMCEIWFKATSSHLNSGWNAAVIGDVSAVYLNSCPCYSQTEIFQFLSCEFCKSFRIYHWSTVVACEKTTTQ